MANGIMFTLEGREKIVECLPGYVVCERGFLDEESIPVADETMLRNLLKKMKSDSDESDQGGDQ